MSFAASAIGRAPFTPFTPHLSPRPSWRGRTGVGSDADGFNDVPRMGSAFAASSSLESSSSLPSATAARSRPGPPLRNPGWHERILDGTLAGFGVGLLGGAAWAVYKEELNFAPAIAGVAGNVAFVTGTFLSCRELTRLMRQTDDWVNSAVGGAMSGSICAIAFKGRAYSASGAALFAAVAGGVHFLREADETGDVYRLMGFQVVPRPDGKVDWVTPAWFPIRRITDEELESNEINFQMRVQAVIDGKMTREEAEEIRAEYVKRRRFEKLKREGKAAEGHEPDEGVSEGVDVMDRTRKGWKNWFRRRRAEGDGGKE